jgi:hypothetical protein
VVLGGGLPRYSERADIHAKAVQETEELLLKIGQRITNRLEDTLGDLFREDEAGAPTVIISGEGSQPLTPSYRERVASPLGSDRFREAVRAFMEGNTEPIIHYRSISDAHTKWCRWAQGRRWGVYLLALWEVVCAGTLGVLGSIAGWGVTNQQVLWSFFPTSVLVLWFFMSEFMLIRQQDVIDDRRNRYKGF